MGNTRRISVLIEDKRAGIGKIINYLEYGEISKNYFDKIRTIEALFGKKVFNRLIKS